MDCIEGFVAAVPTANRSQYIEHARKAADLLKAHGAENDGSNPMPFDGKRIIHGGFETIVDG